MTWIYFARKKGDAAGPIKIGRSNTPEALPLNILATMRGNAAAEMAIRAKLDVSGEWVAPTPQMLAYIESVRQQNGATGGKRQAALGLLLTTKERDLFRNLAATMAAREARETTVADAVRRIIADPRLAKVVVDALRGAPEPVLRPRWRGLYVKLTEAELARLKALAVEAGEAASRKVSVTETLLLLAGKAMDPRNCASAGL